MDDKYIYIYGRHAVEEAILHRPDVVKILYLRDDVRDDFPVALKSKVPQLKVFSGKKLPVPVDSEVVHQGILAKIDREALLLSYEAFMANIEVTSDSCFVVLGELQDPHNVGAVIRSAAAFGASAIFLPKHRQVSLTAAVVKVSAGMAFRMPLVEVGNVNRTIEGLKEAGCFVYGLAGEGKQSLFIERFTKPTVFVLGNEADGIREKTREHCDMLLHIPMHPRCESLNASVSAAIALATWSAQHRDALLNKLPT
ncbi:MAG: 23S rRNA (guanosine(2251)-2'-O)-methyltransferase RlmB [Parcubacteria group bacterium CG2_30_44_11]|nr:MAG: 23S rRNA (guanosine(2251)-2'-O)-methyltransferase RlmB [Parcubacteria group bacterium CG2_30_44_11]